MPRHDRAYGHHHSKRAGGGGTRRIRKKGKNTYAAKAGKTDRDTR